MLSTSIVVPIFNGRRYLSAFFESLAIAIPSQSQVVLIDDGSTEAVFDLIPPLSRAGIVIKLRSERNQGYSAAVNRGFAVCTGDCIIQLNTDLVLDPQCIVEMLEVIEKRPGLAWSAPSSYSQPLALHSTSEWPLATTVGATSFLNCLLTTRCAVGREKCRFKQGLPLL